MTTRRERHREQAHEEIRALALQQIEDSGPDGVSLNAIAKAMGMSGPAIYRYYKSRDDLITALIVDCYNQLSQTLEATATEVRRRAPAKRLHALADAYRTWAVTHPHRYMLMLGHRRPVGYDEPEETIPVIHRSMLVLLDALAALVGEAPQYAADSRLAAQLSDWARRRDGGEPPPPIVLHYGVIVWTRLHGIVSLEIEGVLDSMGLDGQALVSAEIDSLIATAAS